MKLQNMVLKMFCCLTTVCLLVAPTVAQDDAAPTRMTPELLLKLGRLGEAVVSPGGKQIAYTVRRYVLADDKGYSELRLADVSAGTDVMLLNEWGGIGSLQWMNTENGERLFFEGTAKPVDEDDSPSNQAWAMDVSSTNIVQLTSEEDGIANLKVGPNGTRLAFTLDVKLEQKPSEIYSDLPKTSGRIIDQLMYRHWTEWHDYKYSHIHVATISENGTAGEAIDLMKGIKADCPVPPFGGAEQFSWSPDGLEIAYTLKNVKKWAESTNSDVYLVAADGSSPARNISETGEGYDNVPVYSPDGKYIAYSSMKRAGFESDRNRIMLFDRLSGASKELTVGLDQNANGPQWMPDSAALVFESERGGTNQLFKIELENGSTIPVTKGRFNWHIVGFMDGGNTAVTSRTSMLRPAEIHTVSMSDGSDQVITRINSEIYKTLELPIIEERFVEATDGERIHCWVIHPPDFDPKSDKKWPMLTYCQGGPQGQIGQWFSYRWNFHLMAAQGYVVVAPNRRGLPGFGRKWNDQISGDWGGQAMKDILSATDDMTAESYIDNDRVAAVGASFGGYTVYWLMGNHRDRFSAMIAHCGVFDLESMYGSTEELFFVNWDLGGPYWKSKDVAALYNKFSPNRFVAKWKTPLLVIHNEKDFRVPVTQGMEAFTAAQVQGVPSRFLYFPDEGHWVQRPQNGMLWHRVFFEWLDMHCKNAGSSKTPEK